MMNPRNSVELYRKLATEAMAKISDIVPASHNSLFKPAQHKYNDYYLDLYLTQIEKPYIGLSAHPRPDDDTCAYCKNFHLSNLKNIDKNSDIVFGKALEKIFLDFFNLEAERRGIPLVCSRADTDNMHMPDYKVNNADISTFYMEFKAIFRPFIKIAEMTKQPYYQCYAHSLTLDVSNGKKLEDQKKLVEDIGVENVVYVYWYDIPCVKGVFWMPAQRVYNLWENQNTYQRKIVRGDRNLSGTVRAAVNKIYLPLHEMFDFDSLFTAYL